MSDTENTIPVAEVSEVPAETTTEKEKGKTRQMSFSTTDDGLIRADFGEGVEPVIVNPGTLPETILSAATIEGVISRLRGYTSALEGDDRTPENLRVRIQLGADNLQKGIWKVERSGPGSTAYSDEIEAAHIFRVMRGEAENKPYTGTLDQTAENFKSLTDEQKKILKALPRYQYALLQVKERKEAAKKAKIMAAIKAEEGEDAPF